MNWETAVAVCASKGDRLAWVTGPGDTALINMVLGMNFAAPLAETVWIGLKESVEIWGWNADVIGLLPNYSNWAPGQPNNVFGNIGECGAIGFAGMNWHAANCQNL